MIENPKPFRWSYDSTREAYSKSGRKVDYNPCAYSPRQMLPCTTPRTECDDCYMKQQYIDDPLTHTAVHICDRCGEVITNLDRVTYVEATNRIGGTLTVKELCFDCAKHMMKWLDGADGAEYRDFLYQDIIRGILDPTFWEGIEFAPGREKPGSKPRTKKKRWEKRSARKKRRPSPTRIVITKDRDDT